MSDTSNKRKRKQRQTYNCAECRRMKLKCDRNVPCDHCVKRNCPELCPDGVRWSTRKGDTMPSSALLQRLEALEQKVGDTQPSSASASSTAQIMSGEPRSAALAPESIALRSETSNRAIQSEHIQRAPTPITAAAPPQQVPDPNLFMPSDIILPDPLRFDFGSEPSIPVPAVQTSPNYSSQGPAAQAWTGEHAYGTLMLGRGGRSKYLGPTAASEWLKDQEDLPNESQAISRYPSPEAQEPSSTLSFPFEGYISTARLLSRLPPIRDTKRTADCYFRYFAWQHNVIRRNDFEPVLDRVYTYAGGLYASSDRRIDHHELALIFVVLAMGTLHDLELGSNDHSALEYLSLSKQSLSRGNFMQHNTIVAVQTLHTMAHVHLHTEEGRDGDSAWPIWGLTMRLLIAMGLHRDGFRWGLPEDVVQERRRVFWECHSTDIMQANCFSRPASMAARHVDTSLPVDYDEDGQRCSEKSFHILKLELAAISGTVLDMALGVEESPYSSIQALQEQLAAFERNVPFGMRCRAAYLALPSIYSDSTRAVTDSPEANKRNLTLTLQAITMMVLKVFELLPSITVRHWWLWYHAFNAAVCLGTLILRSPRNLLVDFALSQIDTTISLFKRVVQAGDSRRVAQNLAWLVKLRSRIEKKIKEAQANGQTVQPVGDEVEDEGLLGWRTRLIERATKGKQKATTIRMSTPSPVSQVASQPSRVTDADLGATDQLLHQFWDPMLWQTMTDPLDASTYGNWWDIENTGTLQ